MNPTAMPSIEDLPVHVERWAVLRTAARWEKQLATLLAEVGAAVYLPLMTKVTLYHGKRQSFRVPLFSGYVFCAEADFVGSAAVPMVCRKRVAQVLRPDDYGRLHRELHEVSEILTCRKLVQERVFGKPGDRVRIVGGAFLGTEGLIRKLNPAKGTILLEISFLGTRVEVSVEEHLLRKV